MSRWYSALLFSLGILLVGLYGLIRDSARYPFTFDSAEYIEASRNFVGGNGLRVTAFMLADRATETELMYLFPPGYPVLISAGAVFGFDIAESAVWITRILTGALLVALTTLLTPLLGAVGALAVGGFAITAPGVLEGGSVALSDTPFLLVVLCSLILFVRGVEADAFQPRFLFAAGVLVGIAYWLRNAALAVMIGTVGAAGLALLLRIDNTRRMRRLMVWWSVGVLSLALPLWIWNIVAFGTITPYTLPASARGYLANTRDLLEAFMRELYGGKLGRLGDLQYLVLVLLGVLAVLTLVGIWNVWSRLASSQRWLMLLLVCYSVAGSAMLVQARSTYQWGEIIGQRHTLQYAWAILAIMTLGCLEMLRRKPVLTLVAVAVGTVLFAEARIASAYLNLSYSGVSALRLPQFEEPEVSLDIAWRLYHRDPWLATLAYELSGTDLLLSNHSPALKTGTGIGIRQMWISGSTADVIASIAQVGALGSPARPVSIILLPGYAPRVQWSPLLTELRVTGATQTGLCLFLDTLYVLVLRTCLQDEAVHSTASDLSPLVHDLVPDCSPERACGSAVYQSAQPSRLGPTALAQ